MEHLILDGKALAAKIQSELKQKIDEHMAAGSRAPGLAVVQVGENPASTVYVRNKQRACEKVGIKSFSYNLPDLPASEGMPALLALIEELNATPNIDGILCQLPLPDGYDEQLVIEHISPSKDVDGFHPLNQGNNLLGRPGYVPCTPYGIMMLLTAENISPEGKLAIIIGRSNIVGKPMGQLLLQKNATVIQAHSKTKNLADLCRLADIIVVAVGKASFLKADWVKPGAVVIDVGINRLEDGKLCGDASSDIASVAGYYTPVPGGVGPMTVTALLHNTYTSYVRRLCLNQ